MARRERGVLSASVTLTAVLFATLSLVQLACDGGRPVVQLGLEPEPPDDAIQGVIATAINPDPENYPQIGAWLKTRDIAFLTCLFPDVPGLRLDGWIYESSQHFLSLESVNLPADHRLEFRHRFREYPQVIHVMTVTGEPGAIELRGHLELDDKAAPDHRQDAVSKVQAVDASLGTMHRLINGYSPWVGERVPGDPDLAPDICYQLVRAPAFRSAPYEDRRHGFLVKYAGAAGSYWGFAKRSFIFTERGLTLLHETERTEIASKTRLAAGRSQEQSAASTELLWRLAERSESDVL